MQRKSIFILLLGLGVCAGLWGYSYFGKAERVTGAPVLYATSIPSTMPVIRPFTGLEGTVAMTAPVATVEAAFNSKLPDRKIDVRPTFPSFIVPPSSDSPLALAFGAGDGATRSLTRTVTTAVLTPTTQLAGWEWHVAAWDALGWLPHTADCGAGLTVMTGHSLWGEEQGGLYPLLQMRPGDFIYCQSAAGQWHTYRVRQLRHLPFDASPDWRQLAAPQELVLYTCSALADGLVVVWAEPHL